MLERVHGMGSRVPSAVSRRGGATFVLALAIGAAVVMRPGRAAIAPDVAVADTAISAPDRSKALPGPYLAQVIRVVDGDTFEARLRVWFGQDVTALVRLRGIDAPELRAACDSERTLAEEARTALEQALRLGEVVIRDLAPDKYSGRVVASVAARLAPGAGLDDVSALMQAGGYARAYDGGRRQGWCGGERVVTRQARR